jgi:hypothetical protein
MAFCLTQVIGLQAATRDGGAPSTKTSRIYYIVFVVINSNFQYHASGHFTVEEIVVNHNRKRSNFCCFAHQ